MTGSPEHERELLLLIAEGDEKAFAELYNTYVPRLLPLVTGIVRSDAIADELIQETFLRLWIGRDKLTEIKEPAAWIFRIASNICYTHLRRLILERRIVAKLAEAKDEEGGMQAQANELAGLIRRAVDEMPPQRKKIYLLSRESGMSINEIAQALKLSPNTVKNTLVSSLQGIRNFLEKNGYDLSALLIGLVFF